MTDAKLLTAPGEDDELIEFPHADSANRRIDDAGEKWAFLGDGTPHARLMAGESVALIPGAKPLEIWATSLHHNALFLLINGVKAWASWQTPCAIRADTDAHGVTTYRAMVGDELAAWEAARATRERRAAERIAATTRFLVTVRPTDNGPVIDVARIELDGINEFSEYEARAWKAGALGVDALAAVESNAGTDLSARMWEALRKALACGTGTQPPTVTP